MLNATIFNKIMGDFIKTEKINLIYLLSALFGDYAFEFSLCKLNFKYHKDLSFSFVVEKSGS